MPYEIHQVPYCDLHSINLDYILKKLDELEHVDEYVKALFEKALADGSIQVELNADYDAATENLVFSIVAGGE